MRYPFVGSDIVQRRGRVVDPLRVHASSLLVVLGCTHTPCVDHVNRQEKLLWSPLMM